MRPLNAFSRRPAPEAPQPEAPRDPAPTRMAYRLHRLWLTPLFRATLRLGLPMFVLITTIGWFWAEPERREILAGMLDDIRHEVQERPEFQVKLMAVEGASGELDADIREVLPIDFPVSSFALDLGAMREEVSQLDAVAKAELRIRPGGILSVRVEERVPAVIWRSREGLELLDAAGYRVAPLEARAARPDLPLIAGDGADRAVAEALDLIAATGPITARLRGLVRMGERRWDVVLDRDQRILLPEQGARAALERVIALAQAEDMLERDITVVDMRNAARPTLRLAGGAMDEMRRIRLIEAGVSQ